MHILLLLPLKTHPSPFLSKTQRISGNGLALVGCSIEQDAAYWEWQIERTSGGSADDGDDDDDDNAPKFGVATRKDQKFYRALQAAEIDGESSRRRIWWLSLYALRKMCPFLFRHFSCSHIMCSLLTPVPKDNEMSGDDGTALMRSVSVRDGDTVGVAVQQSDLPMIQFLLNGEPLHEIAINRFRGSVFPAIYVREGIKAEVVFDEDNFKELSPHARFGPLIAARGII